MAEDKKPDTQNAVAKEYYTKAGKLFEENKFDEAIDFYSKAIQEDDKYSSAYFNRALSYAIVNKYDLAVRDVDRVMMIEPNSYDAPYVMGVISEYQQDYQGAKEWYEKSLAINPKYEQAKIRLDGLRPKLDQGAMAKPSSATGGGFVPAATQENTVSQDGQLKKVKWFKSNTTFKDIVGMKAEKEIIYQNVILAIKKPELLKAYGKKLGLGVLFYGPPGCGKCLSEDSEVLLPDGRCVTIKEVVDRREPYILTLTEKHKLAVQKVSGWWKLDGKPLLKITTSRGRVVECTPEHPFLTRNGWEDACTLKEGDLIGVPRHIPIFGNTVMKESEIKILAYLISEGSLTQSSPKFTNADPEILEDFQSAIKQFDSSLHTNTYSKVGQGNVLTLQVCGRYINALGPQEKSTLQVFLDTNKLSHTSSYNKKVPETVFTLQKHLLALFLNRLFSGDGWFEEKEQEGTLYGTKRIRKIEYSSNSETLIRQVQHLLLRFGILSSIHKKNGTENFNLMVYKSRDIDIFIDEIGLFGSKAKFVLKKKDSWGKIKKKGGNVVVYEEIKSIENVPAPDYVYDLTVDNTHNFVANNFFVHNTYFVRAIAGETNSNVIIARINEIVDMYAGNTEKNMHAIFEQARNNTPCIIFFDEVDALGTKRDGGGGEGQSFMRMAVNQFLQELDGVERNPEGIFVIGATNQPWDMDPALKRAGRFGESIYLPPPDYRTRKEAFIYHTRKMPLTKNVSFGRLARATMGFSNADLEAIADKAALIPAAEEDRTGKKRSIGMNDFMSMIKKQGNALDEWYGMVGKDIVSKKETQIVDGKKTEIVKEGKLTPEEKVRYSPLVKDVKKNNFFVYKWIKKFWRYFAWYVM